MTEDDLLVRLGYKDFNKGRKRLAAFRDAKGLQGIKHLEKPLAEALGIDRETVSIAVLETFAIAEARDARAFAEAFYPHAILKTERMVPSQITFAALCGTDRQRVIRLREGSSPVTYARQVVAKLPDRLPFYGKVLGFWINYTPDRSVEFDRDGKAVGEVEGAVRIGRSSLVGLEAG
ncbi:hypothetical protein HKCCSP123_12910 [Rhodobacterales bacterium HKCCSP123]|nr:hypothetical protein [Rhodobacterales bacterium HKCCSP123]